MNNDLLRELEILKKRVSELESQKKDNVNMFGRSYSQIGNSNADFLIKTKGQVKVQWGNKFIDLIKDGKIAVDGFQFFTAKDKDSIKGQDGFYITDDGIFIKFGSEIINIFGEVNNAYVSFVSDQQVESKQQAIAQKNIGLLFQTFAEAQSAGIQDGFVYIADEGKIYTIKDFQFQEMKFELPNSFDKKITIKIASGDSCSLLVDGYYDETKHCIVLGKEGSGLYLYSTNESGYVQSLVENLVLETQDGNQILIENSQVTIKPKLICSNIASEGASSIKGYRIYLDGGESVIEVDNLILRKGIRPTEVTYDELTSLIAEENLQFNNYYLITDFQNEWELTSADNIIDEGDNINIRPLVVRALSNSTLDIKAMFVDNPEWEVWYDVSYNDTVQVNEETDGVQSLSELKAKGRIVQLKDQYGNQCNYDFKHLKFQIGTDWKYTFDSEGTDASLDGTMHDNVFEISNYAIKSQTAAVRDGIVVSFSGETHNNTIKTISSDLIVRETFINNSGLSLTNCTIEGTLSNTYFHGSFTSQTISSNINPELSRTDKFKDIYMDESNLRIICIPDLIIPGTIVMFNGERELPAGWAVCDGQNGTPNLIGNFIKASTAAGELGNIEIELQKSSEFETSESISYAELQDGPDQDFKYTWYSLIFIMKL